jgi:hypothetical protein
MNNYNLATHVYKEMEVTYGEIAQALKQLGYQDESTAQNFRFINEAYKSEFLLPARPLESKFVKANTVSFSNLLFMQGVVKNPDKLVKIIEKNRLVAAQKNNSPS